MGRKFREVAWSFPAGGGTGGDGSGDGGDGSGGDGGGEIVKLAYGYGMRVCYSYFCKEWITDWTIVPLDGYARSEECEWKPGGGGEGIGGPGEIWSPKPNVSFASCNIEPCKEAVLTTIRDCILDFIPMRGLVSCAIGAAFLPPNPTAGD